MSIKRQLQFKYQNFVNAFKTIALPDWMTGVAVRLVLSIIIVVAGSAYVFQTSIAATRGYEITSLENQTANLQTDIEKINVEVARESSLTVIDAKIKNLSMVPAGTPKYFWPLDGEMAKK